MKKLICTKNISLLTGNVMTNFRSGDKIEIDQHNIVLYSNQESCIGEKMDDTCIKLLFVEYTTLEARLRMILPDSLVYERECVLERVMDAIADEFLYEDC